MNSKYSCWVYQIRAIVIDDDSTISSYIPFRHKHILFSFVLRVCTVSKYLWKFFHIKSKHYGLEMIYPDEEKITYSYNLGGQLEKVHGYKVIRLRLCEQDRLWQVWAAHILEVLQRCWDLLHLQPTASQIAEPHGE